MRKLLFLSLVFVFAACGRKEEPAELGLDYPRHFPAPLWKGWGPGLEELGKELFFEPALSLDSSISCASCHAQNHAFADLPERRLSLGVAGAVGRRQSPPMFNLAWHPHFMWDGGITNLEIMPLAPITEPHEMALEMREALARLNRDARYVQHFRAVFARDTINTKQVFMALAAFMEALISAGSRYDKYLQGERDILNTAEQRGLALFDKNCQYCHRPPLMSDFSFRDIGLGSGQDGGRWEITRAASDWGKFRVPPLRNLGFTAPYMHDGRFETLEDVLHYYSHEIGASANLDPIFSAGPLQLSEQEQADIIAFLRSLDDHDFVRNTRFASPR